MSLLSRLFRRSGLGAVANRPLSQAPRPNRVQLHLEMLEGRCLPSVYFTTVDSRGELLWQTDGDKTSTFRIKVIHGPGQPAAAANFTSVGQTLFFTDSTGSGDTEFWKSDGTDAGTYMLHDFHSLGGTAAGFLTAMNNTLYFAGDDGVHGMELWKSDGTVNGTERIAFNPFGRSSPAYLTPMNGLLYFAATTGVYGTELYVSDGTVAGTHLVRDINGDGSSNPASLTAVGNTLYFTADDGTTGSVLWSSDGTFAGTHEITTNQNDLIHSPGSLTAAGNQLFFTFDDGSTGNELWVTNGTSAGTRLTRDINGAGSSNPSQITAVGNKVYFYALDGIHGVALFQSDGTTTNTFRIKDANDDLTFARVPPRIGNLNGIVYFVAADIHSVQLWKLDSAGVHGVASFTSFDQAPKNLTGDWTTLYFTLNTPTGMQIWKTDGTAAGTVAITGAPTIGNLGSIHFSIFTPPPWFTGPPTPLGPLGVSVTIGH